MKIYKIICFAAIMFLISLIMLSKSSRASDDCALILTTKCNLCHNLGRICRKLGKKSKSRWRSAINRMVEHGAALSDTQKIELTICLYEQSDNVKAACK